MVSNLRDSGIDIIGNIRWGTHIAQLYKSKSDFRDVCASYIRAGLLNDELCVCIYSQNTSYQEIIFNLSKYIEDVDRYIKSGQLRLIPYTEWYIKDNNFNELRVSNQWNELIEYALDQGFEGLRAVADTSWLERSYFRDFSNYEHNINKIISKLKFTVICLYDANKVDVFEIAEIIKNHSHIITMHENNLELIKNVELLIKDKQLEDSEDRYKKNKEILDGTIEYDRMKTEFFSNISHELKTPLNVIYATIQLIKSNKDEAFQGIKESRYIKIMQQNCFRLLRLVNNIIDITKIDSNYYELIPQNYEIVGLIKAISMSVAEYAMNKGITIHFNTTIKEKKVACDPDQIERIILNLLSNAIKFTPQNGKIWVDIMYHDEKIKITVKDTGRGIPQDKQKYIFNKFQQVDKSLTRSCEGSGIGLSLVKALVEKHNGKITLNSELGKGSEFTIEMPCTILTDLENKTPSYQNFNTHNYVERFNIEFSDIYA